MWYIYSMEYYSAIKWNEIVSFVEMWMNLETVIQSEVSQKEKNKYRISLICGIQKNGTDEPICKAETETQMYGYGGGGVRMSWDIGIDIYTLLCIKQITKRTYYIAQGTLLNALW